MRSILFLLCAYVALATSLKGEPFHFPQDTFSFSNQLYFDYQMTQKGELEIQRRADGNVPDYSRHCFVMVRSVLQFHRFAEFRSDLPKLTEAEYRSRVQRLIRIPPWSSGPASKIQFPGYAGLYSFSTAYPLMLQKNLGIWWPSYWRIGNWRIVFPVPRSGQEHLAVWLQNRIDAGNIEGIYITRMKPINHCLVAYKYTRQPNGDLLFFVYDANQPGKEVHLRYQPADRSFYYDRTPYYPGGLVSAMKLYVSPFF
ncbi:MAG TPA: hypothetical protein VE242_02135 [Chthoniobacterales bacterium]|nr:hypothetical protein [Chthoniobacterales bacterium]